MGVNTRRLPRRATGSAGGDLTNLTRDLRGQVSHPQRGPIDKVQRLNKN